eukprot:8661663-Pyramimonas_sp.AAC.1
MLHNVFSLPPNAPCKVDLLAMAEWSPPPVFRSVQVTTALAAMRSVLFTPGGDWGPFHDGLRDAAWEGSAVQSFHRREAGL